MASPVASQQHGTKRNPPDVPQQKEPPPVVTGRKTRKTQKEFEGRSCSTHPLPPSQTNQFTSNRMALSPSRARSRSRDALLPDERSHKRGDQHQFPASAVCRFFARGHCKHGPNCKYRHDHTLPVTGQAAGGLQEPDQVQGERTPAPHRVDNTTAASVHGIRTAVAKLSSVPQSDIAMDPFDKEDLAAAANDRAALVARNSTKEVSVASDSAFDEWCPIMDEGHVYVYSSNSIGAESVEACKNPVLAMEIQNMIQASIVAAHTQAIAEGRAESGSVPSPTPRINIKTRGNRINKDELTYVDGLPPQNLTTNPFVLRVGNAAFVLVSANLPTVGKPLAVYYTGNDKDRARETLAAIGLLVISAPSCLDVHVVQTAGLPAGSTAAFPVGVSTIAFTATDMYGNSAAP
jgi:hypothetical protein